MRMLTAIVGSLRGACGRYGVGFTAELSGEFTLCLSNMTWNGVEDASYDH